MSRGIEGPNTSASRRATRFPRTDNDTARFADTVDFPTPPFPLATRMMCLVFGSVRRAGGFGIGLGIVAAGVGGGPRS